MAIQTRRGAYENFKPEKLLAGEWATVLSGDPNASDGLAAYACFAPGTVKRMSTYEDMDEDIDRKTGEIVEKLTAETDAATARADKAVETANVALSAASQAALTANQAANRANDMTDELEGKLERGEFNGAPGKDGPAGPQGPPGESGIAVPIGGLFTLSVKENGDLVARYAEESQPPTFRFDSETGNLYYDTEG